MADACLKKLLESKQPVVLNYFSHHQQIPLENSKALFEDLLAWMWLNRQRKLQNKPTYLFGPLLQLDQLWHSFILHTRLYTDFCMEHFGEYFHHEVEPPGEEHHLNEEELRDFLNDCFDYLGEEWVQRNFKDL